MVFKGRAVLHVAQTRNHHDHSTISRPNISVIHIYYIYIHTYIHKNKVVTTG